MRFWGCRCFRGIRHHVHEDVDGFTHPVFGLATAVCYVISFVLLTLALKHLSLGMACGIWGAIGTLLTTLVGVIVWDDPFSVIVGIGMVAVVAGITLLSKGTQEAEEAAEAAATEATARF